MTNKLANALRKGADEGEKAFIPYIMAGDGGLDQLLSRINRLEKAGAAAIELGIPFSDPVADGPVIQRAGLRSLKQGVTLKKIFSTLHEIQDQITIPIIFMSYLNSIMAYGFEQFARDCVKSGVSGCIVPDLPFEEEGILRPVLKESGIVLIRLVTLTSPKERLKKIIKDAEGFIYAVTVKGTTGTRESFEEEVGVYLQEVKALSSVPVLAGFGISTPEHVKQASSYCDGVIVGSKIIDLFEEEKYEEMEELISSAKIVGIR